MIPPVLGFEQMADSRLSALDGLRALAIIPVMLHHSPAMRAAVPEFQSGWAGVDLFFVLSGYLITGILVRSKSKPGYYKNFYARRALRIWPIYYLFLLVIIFVVPRLAKPSPAQWPVEFAPWFYFVFLQNLFLNFNFIPFLAPTWSLVVEEQFYLVWPLLNSLLTKRAMVLVCACGFFASPVIRALLFRLGGSPAIIYGLTFAHMDGLLAGALVAQLPLNFLESVRGRVLGCTLLVTGAGIFLIESYRFAEIRNSIFSFSGLALLFSGLLMVTLSSYHNHGTLSKLLSLSPLAYVGTISYCLYLIHELVQVVILKSPLVTHLPEITPSFLRFGWQLALEFGACIALASLSWFWFESPVLELKKFFGNSETMTSTAAAQVAGS